MLRQPFNYNRTWIERPSNLGVIETVLYDAPAAVDSHTTQKHHLLEALDVGFKGMNGAVAVNRGTNQVIGMFVRRDIELNPAKIQKQASKPFVKPLFSLKAPASSSKSLNHYLKSEYSPIQLFFRNLLGLNIMEERLLRKMSDLKEDLSNIKEDLSYIKNSMLRQSDLNALFGTVYYQPYKSPASSSKSLFEI